jgi:hypothetical protein
MGLVFLLLVPIIICGGMFLLFKSTITWKEFLLQFGVCLLICVAGWFIAKYTAISDTEHWHGVITGKPSGTQSCCHCHDVCVSRDKDGNCTSSVEVCAHNHDYWWSLDTTIGRIDIDSCRGSSTSPRIWDQARIGEPVARNASYKNYLLADPDSLIRHEEHGKFLDRIPDYPKVYNLYRLNSVISDGVPIPAGWQEFFRETNSQLGARKQVDLTVLLTSAQDPTYAQAVEAKWLYGPKNSLTTVIGVKGGKASWARVVTISKVEELKIYLRDTLRDKPIAGTEIPSIIKSGIESKFKRTPMAEFEYLAEASTPKGWVLVVLYIVAILASIGMGIWMHKVDVFGDERRARWSRR